MPAERRKRLEDRGIHIPEFYTAHSWAVPRSIRRDTSMVVLQPSRSGISLLFPSFFFYIYICLLQKCNIIPQCCKEKHPFNAWNTLSPELLELVGSRRTFFFSPNYFFFTQPRSFWSFDVTRNKENNNSGLNKNSKESIMRTVQCWN